MMARNSSPSLWQRAFPAPAKLNLFLHVTARRPDGFHELQTVFRLIDLCDTLRFAPRADDRVVLASEVAGVPRDDDLCARAARALRAATGGGAGVDIHLEKRIPMGGGLGGGSSDAATTLLALNRLWDLGLDRQALAAIAVRLGADVPFFLLGRNAFAGGIGEILAPVELPVAWYLILVPPVAVSTAAVFAAPELTRNSKTITISSFSEHLAQRSEGRKRGQAGGQATGIANEGARVLFGRNDLEAVMCSRYPLVAGHLRWLESDARVGQGRAGVARMSGSGACVFAEFATEDEARSVARGVPKDMRAVVARGLETHPVLELLEHK